MTLVTLDSITREALATCGLPIHYYWRFYHFIQGAFRESILDYLQVVTTAKIYIDHKGEATLPDGFIDYIRIGVARGQYIKMLTPEDKLSRIPNLDADGNETSFTAVTRHQYWGSYGVLINDGGESIGKDFGHGNGGNHWSFKILPERNAIRFDAGFSENDEIIIEYLAYGISTNTASQVSVYAVEALKQYAIWQYKLHSRHFNNQDASIAEGHFYNAERKARARIIGGEITRESLLAAMRKNYSQTIK
jgi:hypothetical protein